MGGHPDFGELEAYRTGEAEPATGPHVESCPLCQRHLEEIKEMARLIREKVARRPKVPPEVEQRIHALAEQNADRVRRELRARTPKNPGSRRK